MSTLFRFLSVACVTVAILFVAVLTVALGMRMSQNKDLPPVDWTWLAASFGLFLLGAMFHIAGMLDVPLSELKPKPPEPPKQ